MIRLQGQDFQDAKATLIPKAYQEQGNGHICVFYTQKGHHKITHYHWLNDDEIIAFNKNWVQKEMLPKTIHSLAAKMKF